MNIHKYLLPASLAATMHVALLWLMPEEPFVRIIEVPLKPVPAKPLQDLPVPPDDPADHRGDTEPVKPLAGKPAPPDLPETPVHLTDVALTMPVDTRVRMPDRTLTEIPAVIGSDHGVLDGIAVSGRTIFSPDSLDRVPNARVQVPPDYPYAMKQSGTGGSVLVEFDVDITGRVVRAGAIHYSNPEFIEAAVRAVKQWRFEPGRRNGRAVPFRMAVPIEFGLEND